MDVILWGATGQALVLHELLERLGRRVVALFDNDPDVVSPLAGRVPVFHGRDGFRRWRAEHAAAPYAGLAAIGGGFGRDRIAIHELFREAGIAIEAAVHPSAFVATTAHVGEGAQILAHAALAAGVRAGEACIVNTSASVDHECELERGVHIGPGATLAGAVRVREYAFVGAGATILPRITIGAGSIVGAGAVVTRDVPAGATVVGNPARVRS